jgi:hypothetical protein
MGSTTRLVKTVDIAKSNFGSVLLRLMMAVNDLGLVNNALYEWNTSTEKRKIVRRAGGRMYFVRVQMAHLFEALGIIKEIRDTPALMAEVERCSKKTQDSFVKVKAFVDTQDYGLLAEIRNSVTFHYDAKRSARAVAEIAEKFPEDRSAFTLGHEPLDWYFELADKVQEKMVVRYIFKVPEGAEIVKESDAIGNQVFDMAEAFADFAGYFIWERAT